MTPSLVKAETASNVLIFTQQPYSTAKVYQKAVPSPTCSVDIDPCLDYTQGPEDNMPDYKPGAFVIAGCLAGVLIVLLLAALVAMVLR